jgi:hypothetical protein
LLLGGLGRALLVEPRGDGGLVSLGEPHREAEPATAALRSPPVFKRCDVLGAPLVFARGVAARLDAGLGGAAGEQRRDVVDHRVVADGDHHLVEQHGGLR